MHIPNLLPITLLLPLTIAASSSSTTTTTCTTTTLITLPSQVTLLARPLSSPQSSGIPIQISPTVDSTLGFYYPLSLSTSSSPSIFTLSGEYLYNLGTGTRLSTAAPSGGLLGTGLLAPEQLYMAADSTATAIPAEAVVKCDGPNGEGRYLLQLVGLLGLHANLVVNGTGGVTEGSLLFTPVTQVVDLDVNLLGTQVEIELVEVNGS